VNSEVGIRKWEGGLRPEGPTPRREVGEDGSVVVPDGRDYAAVSMRKWVETEGGRLGKCESEQVGYIL